MSERVVKIVCRHCAAEKTLHVVNNNGGSVPDEVVVDFATNGIGSAMPASGYGHWIDGWDVDVCIKGRMSHEPKLNL